MRGRRSLKAEALAGEEGFEPSDVGIKIRCLNQLGDSPTRVRARARTLKLASQSAAQPTRGCADRLRHIRPTQPGGSSAGKGATGWSPVPALANTALPEPVMRLLPK